MMSEETTSDASPQPEPAFRLLIAPFDDEQGAVRALAEVLAARREKKVAVPAVAEVRRDAAGAVTINEPGDVGAKEGAVAGGLVGGLLGGLFGRKVLVGAALGAALGALGAEKHDAGIPNPRLREIGAGLPAGASALVAIVPEDAIASLQALLGVEEVRMTVEPIALDLDVARQLAAGQFGEAAGSLAWQAESLIGEAKARLTEAAAGARKKPADVAMGGGETPPPSDAVGAASVRASAKSPDAPEEGA
jgi:uncharacterized membrane protein